MPATRDWTSGPIQLTATLTTNLLNPGTTTGGTNSNASPYDKLRIYLRKITLVNTDSSARTVTMYVGATGANTAGTELLKGVSIAANSTLEIWLPDVPLNTTDFVVGGASVTTVVNVIFAGKIGVA